ncbi:MAG: aminodeoxychorismate synthase component I [bacterium]|nr:aminodeoxychorismate synthase component I [bacterium]
MPKPVLKAHIASVPGDIAAETLFAAVADGPYPFWLDSAMDPDKLGRSSFMGSAPYQVLRAKGERVVLERGGYREKRRGDPWSIAEACWRGEPKVERDGRLPYLGGAVGYFGYELARHLERLPGRAVDDVVCDDMVLAFYDSGLAVDHATGQAYAFATGAREATAPLAAKRAQADLERLLQRVAEAASRPPAPRTQAPSKQGPIRPMVSRQAYLEKVERTKAYIAAGDVLEVCLTHRMDGPIEAEPLALYHRLRSASPAPFAAYLDLGDVQLLSASPERFLRITGRRAQCRPIKGTRPRGRTPDEDLSLRLALAASEKDRCENVMIVDLVRNDLGRVCRIGSVEVTEFLLIEPYATVFQLASTIEGELEPDAGPFDAIRACFPGGSMTGAPKIRAMEIIDELEPVARGPYAGALGYLSATGDVDLNIVIRTILVRGGRAYFHVGGAVVADSDPEAEWRESLDKAAGLLAALGARLEDE